MGETAPDEGGIAPESSKVGVGDGAVGSGDDGGSKQGVTSPPSQVPVTSASVPATPPTDANFSIDDDSASDDGMEDQPIDDEKDIEGSGVEGASSEVGANATAVRDNIAKAVTPTKPMPSSATQVKGADENDVAVHSAAAAAAAAAKESNISKENIPSSPPKIKKETKPNNDNAISATQKSPVSPSQESMQQSMPQSRRSPSEEFGPFEDPAIDTDWNPFGEDDVPREMFSVDEDDVVDTQDSKISTNGGYERKASREKYERKASASSQQTPEAELDSLRRVFDSEYERALEDQEISWRARYGATRLSFIMSALLMVVYLWLGCMFYRSEAGWSVPDALLFTVYTVTTVGYGGPQPLPNTAAFHAFTSVYVLVGISLVTVLGAHTYQLVTLEAARVRSSNPWGSRGGQQQQSQDGQSASNDITAEMDKYRQQFMSELEDLVRERPLLDAAVVKFKEFQIYLRTTKSGRVLSVALPFLGMIFLGAIVVGTIEEWSPLESLYWSIVTLTTVGYGDYTPTKNSSVWFCTLFFIPSSLFFLSFLLAHVAKSYIRLHAIHVTRLERKMRRKNEKRRAEAARGEKAKRNTEKEASEDENTALEEQKRPPESPGASSTGSAKAEDMEKGFTTIISYMNDDAHENSPTKSIGLFGDQAGNIEDVHNNNDPLSSESSPALRYRENVIRNKEAAPDPSGNRVVSFAEALRSLNRQQSPSLNSQLDQFENEGDTGIAKPSLEVRLRVQARLARIIAEEVAGYQTGVIIKGSTVSLTVGSLRDTAEKWKIPNQAWKAFRAVAFRSLLFVGERELISEGGDALLRLNVVEFHQIFSPMLAAMGDGSSMEAWLAATDILADVELRGGARYGRGKPVFNGTFT